MDTIELRSHAFEYAREGMVITDPHHPDHPIVDVNPAFEVLTGYSKADIIGRNCRFLQKRNINKKDLAEIRTAIREERHCRVTIKNYRKDGSMFWNELSVSPIYDQSGRLLAFIGIQRDATTRIMLEQKYLDDNEQLKLAHATLEVQLSQRKSLDERINDVIEQAIRYTS